MTAQNASPKDVVKSGLGTPRLEPLGDNKNAEIIVEPDRITVKDHFTVERVGDLWLLRGLGQREVQVNEVPTMASFLEGGESLVSGELRYRLVATEQPAVEEGGRRSLPWVELVLLLLIGVGIWLWYKQPVETERVVMDPPPLSKYVPPFTLNANPTDALIQARLILGHCKFFVHEHAANDGYLRHAIQDLEYLKRQAPGLNLPDDLRQEIDATLSSAQQTLTDEVKRLRNNAIIASASGRSEQYLEILNKMTRVIEDPRDPVYRWAMFRIEARNR